MALLPWNQFDRIGRCARCGNDHHDITAYKFRRPPEETDYVAFATCPTTGEPILFSVIGKTDESLTSEEDGRTDDAD